MGVALLDSSAVIGYLDRDDTLHASAADAVEESVRGGSPLAISAVTWAELLHGAHLGHSDETAVREFVRDFGVAILPVDAEVAEHAAALQATYAGKSRGASGRRLRTPDALILATASASSEIDAVIAGDDRWPKVTGVQARIVLLRERRRG